MKVHVDIELTPEEARQLLGLPDLEPLQRRILEQMETRLSGYLNAMEPESILKAWVPMGLQGLEKWQDLLWSAAKSSMGRRPGGSEKTEPPKSK